MLTCVNQTRLTWLLVSFCLFLYTSLTAPVIDLTVYLPSSSELLDGIINQTLAYNPFDGIGNVTVEHYWASRNFTRATVHADCTNELNLEELHAELNQPVWVDIDWEGIDGRRHAACGSFKCYLNSATNESVGYLVAQARLFPQMSRASSLVAQLRETMGANVLEFPGETPQLVNISTQMACLLADYSYQMHRTAERQQIILNPSMTQVVVHRVRRAPEPYIILGVSKGKRRRFRDEWATFMKDNNANRTEAYLQFSREIEKVRQSLKTFPNLAFDFQGLIDTHGTFYHMDMDRLFEKNFSRSEYKEALEDFDYYIPQFLKVVRQAAEATDSEDNR